MASFISFKYKKFLLGIKLKAAGIPLFLCLVIFHAFQFLKSIVLLEIHVIDSFKIFFFCFNFCLFYVIVTFTSQNLVKFLNLAMLEVDVALSFGLMGLCNKRKIFGKKKYGDKINMDGGLGEYKINKIYSSFVNGLSYILLYNNPNPKT